MIWVELRIPYNFVHFLLPWTFRLKYSLYSTITWESLESVWIDVNLAVYHERAPTQFYLLIADWILDRVLTLDLLWETTLFTSMIDSPFFPFFYWIIVGDMTEKVQKMTLQIFDLPKRKVREIVHAGPHVQRKILIEVNYLPLKIKDPKLRIYHYDVNFNPDKPKYLLR